MARKLLPGILLIIGLTGCTTIPRFDPPRARDIEKPAGFCVSWKSAGADLPGIALNQGGWIRVDFKWSRIEQEKGSWNFEYTDRIVRLAGENNVRIIGVLLNDTPWIKPRGKTNDYIPPGNIPDYCRFVREVALRYGDRVDVWEIWNEPNTLHWGGPRSHFFKLYAAALDTLEETLEDPYVTTPGVFGGDTLFLRAFFRNIPAHRIDALSFHPYGLNPEGSARIMLRMIREARKLGFTGDIIISEIGYPTGGLYPTRQNEPAMGDAVIKSMGYALASGARIITWYKFSDNPPRRAANSEDWFGLTLKGNPVQEGSGITAYRFLTRHINNTRIEPNLTEVHGLKQFFCLGFLGGDYTFVLFWGKKGTPVLIQAAGDILHGTTVNLENPSPLPPCGVITLSGRAEFLLITPPEAGRPAAVFTPPENRD